MRVLVALLTLTVAAYGQWGEYWTNDTPWIVKGFYDDLSGAIEERETAANLSTTVETNTTTNVWITLQFLKLFDSRLLQIGGKYLVLDQFDGTSAVARLNADTNEATAAFTTIGGQLFSNANWTRVFKRAGVTNNLTNGWSLMYSNIDTNFDYSPWIRKSDIIERQKIINEFLITEGQVFQSAVTNLKDLNIVATPGTNLFERIADIWANSNSFVNFGVEEFIKEYNTGPPAKYSIDNGAWFIRNKFTEYTGPPTPFDGELEVFLYGQRLASQGTAEVYNAYGTGIPESNWVSSATVKTGETATVGDNTLALPNLATNFPGFESEGYRSIEAQLIRWNITNGFRFVP